MRLERGLVGALIGVLPGLIMYLIAEFLIKGEWQLTIGAPGILIGICGAILGFALGFFGRKAPSSVDDRRT